MEDATPSSAETAWWVVRPEAPSRLMRALAKLGVRAVRDYSLQTETVPAVEIDSLRDEDLREALRRQVRNAGSDHVVVPVAYPDGSFSHANVVRREPLMLKSAQTNEDN